MNPNMISNAFICVLSVGETFMFLTQVYEKTVVPNTYLSFVTSKERCLSPDVSVESGHLVVITLSIKFSYH